jgi:hypothetical protein
MRITSGKAGLLKNKDVSMDVSVCIDGHIIFQKGRSSNSLTSCEKSLFTGGCEAK